MNQSQEKQDGGRVVEIRCGTWKGKIMKKRFTANRDLLPQQQKSWKLTRLFWKVRLKMPSGFPDFYLFRR